MLSLTTGQDYGEAGELVHLSWSLLLSPGPAGIIVAQCECKHSFWRTFTLHKMDPLSISAACVGVASGAATLSTQIFRFAAQVRASRRDMDAISREVSSLQMCLETLRDDAITINYPPRIKQNIYDILKNCEAKINEMVVLLVTVEARNLGRGLQWTVMYRDQVNAMRASLEVYKSSLEIALELGSTLLITAVQDTTDATRRDVAVIRQDMAQVTQLLAGTRALRVQFHHLEEQGVGISIPLQRFLDETETYAESVRGPDDISEADWEARTVTANDHHDIAAATPFTGSDNGRSMLAVPERTVPLVPTDDVSRHISGKFAAFVYVVPVLQADVDGCLAARKKLSGSERARLNAELKTATMDKSRQYLTVIKTLVEKGADCTKALRSELETKLYPRHDVVFYLISMGATVDLNSKIGHHRNCADIFRFLLHQKLCNLEVVNRPGVNNVLHTAMGHDSRQIQSSGVPVSLEAIEALCEHGADVNYGGQNGDTPLHTALNLAVDGWGTGESSDFVRVLLEWGAGPLVVGSRYQTALQLADSELGNGPWKSRYSRCRGLVHEYASGRLEAKNIYYPGRPCSCRFTPLPETVNTTATPRRPLATTIPYRPPPTTTSRRPLATVFMSRLLGREGVPLRSGGRRTRDEGRDYQV